MQGFSIFRAKKGIDAGKGSDHEALKPYDSHPQGDVVRCCMMRVLHGFVKAIESVGIKIDPAGLLGFRGLISEENNEFPEEVRVKACQHLVTHGFKRVE